MSSSRGREQRAQLEQAIAHLEGQRQVLGDAVADASIAALRKQLAELDASEPGDEQRKLVTVLFADLAGWTRMSEQLDPEDMAAVQQDYFDAVTPAIREHGGRVEKYIGDAILAVFGVPQAREDDPVRAVRAALAMQQALSALNARLPNTLALISGSLNTGSPALSLRIGIHTGLAMVRLGADPSDFVVTGDTVNLASRLESACPPGGVLISHGTYQHVRGLFDLQEVDPLALKGKRELVQAYLVTAARNEGAPAFLRGVEGVVTPLVGREPEFLALQHFFRDAAEDGEPRAVTVVGDVGVGKSRLLLEFQDWINRQPTSVMVFQGRAPHETQTMAYGLLRHVLSDRFGIRDSDSNAQVREKLERSLGRGDSAEPRRQAHLIGQLLGFDFSDSLHVRPLLDSPRHLHESAVASLIAFFRDRWEESASIILLEDLHWADDSSLDVLDRLVVEAGKQAQARLLLVATARPQLYERRPHWGEGQVQHSRLDLRPLSRRDSRRLVSEILSPAQELPESLQDLIVSSAEGNPFFVEELIKTLIEDRVVVKAAEVWRVDPQRLPSLQVPATLVGILQARLDRLPLQERVTLQQASVVGRTFWDGAVLAISQSHAGQDRQHPDREGSQGALDALRAREMVFSRERSSFSGAREYIFKHALLREVTYESVLKRLRQVYHSLAADWLIQQAGERLPEYAALVAEHLELARRSAEALDYLVKAAEQAAGVHAHREAAESYARAISSAHQLHEPPGRLLQLYLARGRMLEHAGRFGEAVEGYQELEALALQEDNRHLELAAIGRLAACYIEPSDVHNLDLADRLIKRGLQLARELGDHEQEAHLLWTRTVQASHYGSPKEAMAAGEACIAIARQHGLEQQLATALHDLSLNLRLSGEVKRGAAYAAESRALLRKLNNLPLLVDNLNQQGLIDYLHLDFDAALDHVAEAATISRQIENLWNLSYASWIRGMVAHARGRWTEAEAGWHQSMRAGSEAGFLMALTMVPMQLGFQYRELGRIDEAVALHKQAMEACVELAPFLLPAAEAQLALDAFARGDVAAGLSWTESSQARQELGVIGAGLALPMPVEAVVASAEHQDDWSRALAVVDEALLEAEGRQLRIHQLHLLLMRASCLTALSRAGEAHAILSSLLEVASHHGLLPLQRRVHAALAQAAESSGDAREAAYHRQAARQFWPTVADSLSSQ